MRNHYDPVRADGKILFELQRIKSIPFPLS
jgi:hypothetical protein